MNYGDQQQQQQEQQQRYMAQQRMAQQGQRMPMQMPQQQGGMPGIMQQQQLHQPGMRQQPQQQQPNSHMPGQYSMQQQSSLAGTSGPQMQRLIMPPQGQAQMGVMYQQPPDTDPQMQQQQGNREILSQQMHHFVQNLPAEERLQLQQQMHREADLERKKLIMQGAVRKKQMQQQQQRMFEQQQQTGMMNAGGVAPGMSNNAMQMNIQQRMAVGAGMGHAPQQQNQSPHQPSMLYGQSSQQQQHQSSMSGGQQGISAPTVHMQRIPSQGAFNAAQPPSDAMNQIASQQQQHPMMIGSQTGGSGQQQQMVSAGYVGAQQQVGVVPGVQQPPQGFNQMSQHPVPGQGSNRQEPQMGQQGMQSVAGPTPASMQQMNPQQQQQYLQHQQQQQMQFQQQQQQFHQQQQMHQLHAQSQQHLQQPSSNQGITAGVGTASSGPHSQHSQNSSPMPPHVQLGPTLSSSSSQLQQQGGPPSNPTHVGGPSSNDYKMSSAPPRSIPASQYMGSPAAASVGPASVSAAQNVPGAPTPASGRPNTPASRSVPNIASVPAPQSVPAPASVDQSTPEYKATLAKLKAYHEPCKRLIARIRIDVAGGITTGAKLETSLERVFEIMEGRRVVEIKLLERLINNVKSALTTHNPVKHLLEIVSKLSKISLGVQLQASESSSEPHKPFPDCWQDVRHLQIKLVLSFCSDIGLLFRLPDHILRLVESRKEKEEVRSSAQVDLKSVNRLKRKAALDVGEEGSPAKREKNLLDALASSFSTIVAPADSNETKKEEEVVRVECLNGNWIPLSKSASSELSHLPFPHRFDPDFKPISESCPHVQLLIHYKQPSSSAGAMNSSIPPLRLLLPVDYPDSPAQLCGGSDGGGHSPSSQIMEELKLQVDLGPNTSMASLTQLTNTWAEVVEVFFQRNRRRRSSFGSAKMEPSLAFRKKKPAIGVASH